MLCRKLGCERLHESVVQKCKFCCRNQSMTNTFCQVVHNSDQCYSLSSYHYKRQHYIILDTEPYRSVCLKASADIWTKMRYLFKKVYVSCSFWILPTNRFFDSTVMLIVLFGTWIILIVFSALDPYKWGLLSFALLCMVGMVFFRISFLLWVWLIYFLLLLLKFDFICPFRVFPFSLLWLLSVCLSLAWFGSAQQTLFWGLGACLDWLTQNLTALWHHSRQCLLIGWFWERGVGVVERGS